MFLFAACSEKTNVEIYGTIKDAGNSTVYLDQNDVNAQRTIDSAKIDKKGSFKFKTNITQPTFYTLRFPNEEQIVVIASPDEKLEISGNLKDLSDNYWVDGTTDNSLWIKLLTFQLNRTKTITDSVKQAYQALPKGKEYDQQRQEYTKAWEEAINKQINFTRDFILKHAVSPAAYYALYQQIDNNLYVMDEIEDLHYFKVVASSMSAMYPESQYTKAIMNHLDKIYDAIRNQQLVNVINNSEQSLPNIKLPNVKNDTLSLLPIKNKLVVLDFNLITAPESKEQIEQMKAIYNRFKKQGVEIYQVCLDNNKLQWEEAIRQYGITWQCVWDANALRSRSAAIWNVKNIPANYIINQDMEIVGKNLYGNRLADRLNDLLQRK